MDISQYKDIFLSETKEHLLALNKALLELENNPKNLEVVDEIFRSAHTIKGMSATMGYKDVTDLTHAMEDVLDKLRKGQAKADFRIVDALFDTFDVLEKIVQDIASDKPLEIDVDAIIKRLKNLLTEANGARKVVEEIKQTPDKIPGEKAPVVMPVEEDVDPIISKLIEEKRDVVSSIGKNVFIVKSTLNKDCVLKSARAFMVLQNLRSLGDIIHQIPAQDELLKEDFGFDFYVLIASDKTSSEIKKSAESVLEVKEVMVIPLELEKDGGISKKTITDIISHEEKIKPGVAPQEAIFQKTQHLRIPVERLDKLHDLVGELVIAKGRLLQISSKYNIPDLNDSVALLARQTTNLQDEIMQARMVPVGYIFERFPRLVRDSAKELGKEVALVIEGKEIELDRSMLDQIGEPLVHLLRNAVDHGIEPPDEREKIGKPRKGTIRLVAERLRNNIIISVEDDGRGINIEKVKKKAREMGIIDSDEYNTIDDKSAMLLITHSGFSTAEKITDVSGRGVGMDVVKNKIRAIGGILDVESKFGEGSKFTIKLPLTLAIIQAMFITVQKEIYAIPLSHILETMEFTPDKQKTIKGREVITYRGEVLSLIDLSKALNVPTKNNGNVEQSIVIVETGKGHLALLVDSLLGQEEIVVKPVEGMIPGVENIVGFSGVTIRGDGTPAFILDVSSFM